jgi:hypothetical protein
MKDFWIWMLAFSFGWFAHEVNWSAVFSQLATLTR